jgi:hypothetical protein
MIQVQAYLTSATKKDRVRTRKLGSKNVDYANKCLNAAKTFKVLLPPTIDIPEFEKDVVFVNAIAAPIMRLYSLLEQMEDTKMLAGSDAMMASDETYAALKRAAKHNAAVKSVVDEIAQLKKQNVKKDKSKKMQNKE